MNVFSQKDTPIAKQKTTLNLKGNTPLLHYQIITLPITWMFTFKQHQSSHGRQKSITYVYIYIPYIYVDKNKIK